jgi:hypothetical protein
MLINLCQVAACVVLQRAPLLHALKLFAVVCNVKVLVIMGFVVIPIKKVVMELRVVQAERIQMGFVVLHLILIVLQLRDVVWADVVVQGQIYVVHGEKRVLQMVRQFVERNVETAHFAQVTRGVVADMVIINVMILITASVMKDDPLAVNESF